MGERGLYYPVVLKLEREPDERRGCTFCKGKDRKRVVSSGKGSKNEGECCNAVVGDGLDGEFCCNCGVWERF